MSCASGELTSQLQVLDVVVKNLYGSSETIVFGMTLAWDHVLTQTRTVRSLVHQDYGHGYLQKW
jgi:hypothetical protein